jgi:hypothetical protein
MKREFWIYVSIILVGIVIVALPDNDIRVFDTSDKHGPAWLDVIGLLMVMIPWLILAIGALAKWRIVLLRLGRRLVTVLIAIAAIGLMIVAVSIRSDNNTWLTGAAISAIAQMVLMVVANRKK